MNQVALYFIVARLCTASKRQQSYKGNWGPNHDGVAQGVHSSTEITAGHITCVARLFRQFYNVSEVLPVSPLLLLLRLRPCRSEALWLCWSHRGKGSGGLILQQESRHWLKDFIVVESHAPPTLVTRL